ncbi:MAG TPA: hypothetical protein VGH33_17270 [Isosphaeraceae bacterium]
MATAGSEHEVGGAATDRTGWGALVLLMAAYAALFVAYYPPLPGIEDEAGYLNQALVWSHGAISAEGAGYPDMPSFFESKGRHVSGRNPGRSLAALPFLMAGGVAATFASGLLIHLATTAVAAAVLARLGRSPLWAALVLFHPTLAIYSRTIMGDEAAGLGLLLAAWAVTRTESPRAGLWAGLAVGLAALMRYHAGLALPFVASAFRFPAARPRPWRQAALCLASGGLCGGLIVAYNLAMFGRATDPNPTMHGPLLDTGYVAANAKFYAVALMLVWPGMLLAPILDRSILRWLARGICGLYLAFFLACYWYDQGGSWAETCVLGLRLISVALPVWIVSYAGVVDEWVAAPLRRRIGRRWSRALAAAGCLGLLAATGLMFARHQRHLDDLGAARAAMARAVPDGASVIANGAVYKLFAIPSGPPSYRWLGAPPASSEAWYVAVLAKTPGDPTVARFREFAEGLHMTRVPSGNDRLLIYQSQAAGANRGPADQR